MPLFSERSGNARSYSSIDLYEAVEAELKTWDISQLLYRAFGGEIYFDSDETDDEPLEFKSSGELTNPAAFLRRELRTSLDFNFRDANMFVRNLPPELNPRYGKDIELFLDFLELLYGLVATISYSTKSKKLTYNKKNGQKVFRDAINPDLAIYKVPYTMLSNGQIVEISQKPIAELAENILLIEPSGQITSATITPLQTAASNYLGRGATLDQKKQAVRDLADALESLRPKIKENLLSDDEKELFKIANQFAIRHNDNKQKTDYDKSIWYDWMFHVNLAALLTVIRILQEQEK